MKKGPFVLRAMKTVSKVGSDLTFWSGCWFMPRLGTLKFTSLPELARRFRTLGEAKRGAVEWALRYPVVIGQVEVVDMRGFSSEWL